jgi:hypothetical protein
VPARTTATIQAVVEPCAARIAVDGRSPTDRAGTGAAAAAGVADWSAVVAGVPLCVAGVAVGVVAAAGSLVAGCVATRVVPGAVGEAPVCGRAVIEAVAIPLRPVVATNPQTFASVDVSDS